MRYKRRGIGSQLQKGIFIGIFVQKTVVDKTGDKTVAWECVGYQ